MGIIRKNVKFCRWGAGRKKCKTVKAIVDTGSFYSQLPAQILQELGIKPHLLVTLRLANNKRIRRPVGSATCQLNNKKAPCSIVFGKEHDPAILGVSALEALGATFNSRTGKIKYEDAVLMVLNM